MTRYGWDASNHDWGRGPMNLALAKQQGISLFTHKASEGSTFTDPNFAQAMGRAQPVNFPVLGTYHVLWPNNPLAQADFWISRVNTYAPWWRNHPCFIWQIDAELFQNFNPYRQPTVAEINACGDRVVNGTGIKPSQVVVYAPEWLYSGTLTGLRYRCLWASSYAPGTGSFQSLYTAAGGDGSSRWHAYSGITPTILQYTSTATIAGQSPADANAIRVSSDAALQGIFTTGDDGMSADDVTAVNAHTDQMLALLWQAIGGQDNSVFSGGTTSTDAVAQIKQQLGYLQSWIGGSDNSVYSGGTTALDVQTALTAAITASQETIIHAIEDQADECAAKVIAALPAGAVTVEDLTTALKAVFAQLGAS